MAVAPRFLRPLFALRKKLVSPEPIRNLRLIDGPDGAVDSFDPRTPFALFLRQFEGDAKHQVGNSKGRFRFDLSTLESALAAAAARSGLPLVAIQSPHDSLRPAELVYLVAPEDWRGAVTSLVRQARVIILLCTRPVSPTPSEGSGFDEELTAVASQSTQNVVVVLPPELTPTVEEAKKSLLGRLGWAVPESPLLVAFKVGGQVGGIPSLGPMDDSLARRYENGVVKGISAARTAGPLTQ